MMQIVCFDRLKLSLGIDVNFLVEVVFFSEGEAQAHPKMFHSASRDSVLATAESPLASMGRVVQWERDWLIEKLL